MTILPDELREEIVQKTHGQIIAGLNFFKDKSAEFNYSIIYELKPMNIEKNEVLYSQYDVPENIYFIISGKFKLYVDLIDYLKSDEELKTHEII